jgi:RimJ/RimL family protein N-acetyltransferase
MIQLAETTADFELCAEIFEEVEAERKSHRRRGIATAMKRVQIAWAREHGYAEIDSDMVEGNVAMRGVNERLGYAQLPASIVVEGWPA